MSSTPRRRSGVSAHSASASSSSSTISQTRSRSPAARLKKTAVEKPTAGLTSPKKSPSKRRSSSSSNDRKDDDDDEAKAVAANHATQSASTSSNATTTSLVDTSQGGVQVAPGVIDNEKGNWSKWRLRTITTLLMLGGFILFIAAGQMALWFLVVAIQSMMFREIVTLGYRVSKERAAPGQRFLQWYFFVVTMVYMNLRSMKLHFRSVPWVATYMSSVFNYFDLVCFFAYVVGLVLFVWSLKHNYYKYQFGQFGWCHLTLLMVVFTSHFSVINMFRGLIWFVLPSLLIIANDIFAYIFGFFFGRRFIQRGLIDLSPKKTWEGFIGATIVTFFFGFSLSWAFAHFQMFVCAKHDFTLGIAQCDQIDSVFQFAQFQLPNVLQTTLSKVGIQWHSVGIAPIQFHAMVFALFASIFAPFGGFFASGFKRAFKIKDFGDSIPGHGGFTDRMDCQMLLGLFVFVYYDTFIKKSSSSSLSSLSSSADVVAMVLALFAKLSFEQQDALLAKLKEIVANRTVV